MQDQGTYFKILSLLLQYPDEAFLAALPELEAAAAQLQRSRERTGIETFVAEIKTRRALDLQERYTAAFDLNPATTLNMTYHVLGESDKRAVLMARLQQAYTAAGYEKTTAELPDFLPLVLEFLALVPPECPPEAIRQCCAGLPTLVDRLETIAPFYGELLRPLAGLFGDPLAADRSAESID
jgi:nitrate reductase delta subunit